MKFTAPLWTFLVLLLTFRCGATITEVSGLDLLTVSNAVLAASTGDTLILPRGTANWTNVLTLTKSLRIMGYGSNQTTIYDFSTNSAKKVIDNQMVSNTYSRIAGITFRNGNRVHPNESVNGILVNGSNSGKDPLSNFFVRIDHCNFYDIFGQPIGTFNVQGLYDHNYVHFLSSKRFFVTYVQENEWGKTGSFGDGAWALAADHNSTNWVTMEDNIFDNPIWGVVLDGQRSGYACVRFNDFTNSSIAWHGTENEYRGTRLVHVYNNRFTLQTGIAPTAGFVGALRSGTHLIVSNYLYGNWTSPGLKAGIASAYRTTQGSIDPFIGADGTNDWDSNAVLVPYLTGTHNGGNNVHFVQDTTKPTNWLTDQWYLYSVQNKTKVQLLTFSLISGNTSNTLALFPGYDNASFHATNLWDNGDTYQIWKVVYALDQPGSKGGTLINRSGAAWPSQFPTDDNSISRAWSNIWVTGGNQLVRMSAAQICREGESFTNDVPLAGWSPMAYPHPAIALTALIPPAPNTPSPADGATGVDGTSVNLSWIGLYAFYGYAVYFDTVNPPVTQAAAGWQTNTFNLQPLAKLTTYYWRIGSTNYDGGTNGPVWSFTTTGTPSASTAIGNRSMARKRTAIGR